MNTHVAFPALDHHRFPADVKRRVAKELLEIDGTVGTHIFAQVDLFDVGFRFFRAMERSQSSVDFLSALMMEHWVPRCNPPWAETDLRRLLSEAMTAYWEEKAAGEAAAADHRKAEEAARRKKFAAKQAKERAEKERRIENAKLHQAIADEFGVTLRHARNMRSEGTTNREFAERLATILGTDPETHLRKTRRSNRDVDLVQMFMDVQYAEVTFARFASNFDRDGFSNDLMDFIRGHANCSHLLGELKTLEDMIERVRLLGYEPLSLELAEQVWKAYKLWRIRTICSAAVFEVEMGI